MALLQQQGHSQKSMEYVPLYSTSGGLFTGADSASDSHISDEVVPMEIARVRAGVWVRGATGAPG